MSFVIKIAKWLSTVVVAVVVTITVIGAFGARKMIDLSPEHHVEFQHEFDASMENSTDWSAYLGIEEKLASELADKIENKARPDSIVDRYSRDSLTYPGRFDGNWNRSYEMSAASPKGVAVLLHGLSDSPYSMLSTAQTLVGAGYNVVVPRMPGHGFAVGGLLDSRWEDWAAAVRIAVRHAVQLPGGDESLLMVGYSNGGLMAIDYALRCDAAAGLPCPDHMIMLSPAIAITSLAVMSNWHVALSWIPYFEKSKWLSVLPEIDPFKFTSFPKRAGWEIYRLSTRTYKKLKQPGMAARLPPILTFQSYVDNTVSARAIITNLYDLLPANGSEIVIYDINRNSTLLHLMHEMPGDPADYFESVAPLNYGVSILKNRSRSGRDINVFQLAAGERTGTISRTDFAWPETIYSLSHIAIPFRSDDKIYGNGLSRADGEQDIAFGALAPRGEQGVLLLSSDYFLRTRYNPFFPYQARYLKEWLGNP